MMLWTRCALHILTYGCRDEVQQREAATSGEQESEYLGWKATCTPEVNPIQLGNFSVLQVPNLQVGIFRHLFSETPRALESRSCSFVIYLFKNNLFGSQIWFHCKDLMTMPDLNENESTTKSEF